uniref:Uncharacterized protein n=1 Tax=Chenopodium quinoa TaxID=63459 RepID=A0A803MB95_CHEQI
MWIFKVSIELSLVWVVKGEVSRHWRSDVFDKWVVNKAAATFAPRASTASKNPAVPGSTLYSVFEIQGYASMLLGGVLSFNLVFPSNEPDIWRLMGMWSIWMFTIPSLRARDCSNKEKEALNYLFLLIPLLNVIIPFFWKSFAVVWSADTVAFFLMYAWKSHPKASKVCKETHSRTKQQFAAGCSGSKLQPPVAPWIRLEKGGSPEIEEQAHSNHRQPIGFLLEGEKLITLLSTKEMCLYLAATPHLLSKSSRSATFISGPAFKFGVGTRDVPLPSSHASSQTPNAHPIPHPPFQAFKEKRPRSPNTSPCVTQIIYNFKSSTT